MMQTIEKLWFIFLGVIIGFIIGYSIEDNSKLPYTPEKEMTLKQEIDAWDKEKWAKHYIEWHEKYRAWDVDYSNRRGIPTLGEAGFTEYLKQQLEKEKIK